MYSNMNKLNNRLHRIRHYTEGMFLLFLIIGLMTGCVASKQSRTSTPEAQPKTDQGMEDANTSSQTEVQPEEQSVPYSAPASSRPSVSWQPSFTIEDIQVKESALGLPELKVGANINTKSGKVVLREVIKVLAGLKGMNVSWTNDVDQDALVDVAIVSADEDFWIALTNILRQLDYFFEFKKNTIIIKYKDTKRFYLPMPFLTGSFTSSVGGDLLGGEETSEGAMRGTLSVEQKNDAIDLWVTVENNLDKLLCLGSTQATVSETEINTEINEEISSDATTSEPQPEQEQSPDQDEDRENFFYLIDKPLGIVTVTAPRSLLVQVETYLETLKKELSRQVMIEAKIIEVQLDSNTQKGIDWSELFKDSLFTAYVTFGDFGRIYPKEGAKFIGRVDLFKGDINLLLNFLEEHGNVKVLSNPKLALLNGQPAMITVGENVHYIDNVTTTIDSETKTVTYTVETNSILSGIGFGVMASISSDDEVILHITPVTSQLQEPIEYRDFGTLGGTVGLPRVLLRELTTVARIKSGQLLIIGGLIDEVKGSEDNKVPLLGDVPLLGNVFKNSRNYTNKKELIILLRPQIVGI